MVMEGQRREERPRPQSRSKEYLSRLRVPLGWLGRTMTGNGNHNGGQPQPNVPSEPPSQTEEWDRIVDEAVDAASAKQAEKERQKFARDIVRPLRLGPQRYVDPAIWGPAEHLRPVIGGSGPDSEEKVPLTQDPHYAEVGTLLDELDATLRWPGED